MMYFLVKKMSTLKCALVTVGAATFRVLNSENVQERLVLAATKCEEQCSSTMIVKTSRGISDPYNFERGKRGTVKKIPFNKARNINWVFTGAFKFMNEKSIDKCCRNKGKCFQARTSCFRAVYYKKYIEDALSEMQNDKKTKIRWK